MRKAKFYSGTVSLVFVGLLFLLLIVGTGKAEDNMLCISQDCGSDFVLIDGMKVGGCLERPPVAFPHDRHTSVLLKEEQDCTMCHSLAGDRLSYKFKRLKDVNRETTMQVYHDNCIDCHSGMIEQTKKTGPVTCGGCHKEINKLADFSVNIPVLDKYLHYSHIKSNDGKCELCHHDYDVETKKLVYEKGQENPCSYCHGEKTVKNTISFKEASHQSCIGCHRGKKSIKAECGPIVCVGCHGVQIQDGVDKFQNIPRIDRGQPDTILIGTDIEKDDNETSSSRMRFVPFDHKSHEEYQDRCIDCHHSSLEACDKCHVNYGSDDGKYITLSGAMHGIREGGRNGSCIGCHRSKQKENRCYGCHSLRARYDNFVNSTCDSCHLASYPEEFGTQEDEIQYKDNINKLLSERVFETKIYSEEKIPETVTIGGLEDKYSPVIFPHRKIVLSLADRIKDSNLALYFHRDQGTLCLGCHHNSPVSVKPPGCASCHSAGVNTSVTLPTLVSAYHQQCIRCHNAMGLEKPDSQNCTACHASKDSK